MAERPVGKRRATGVGGSEVKPADIGVPDGDAGDLLGQPGAAGEPDAVREPQAHRRPEPPERPASFDDAHTALPPRVESWRKRSATGAILTGFALGLQQVFEPERKEPAIVQETSGDPPTDLPVEAELEGVVGRRSVVRIRPWLLDEDMVGVEGDSGTDRSATTTGVAPRARRSRRLRKRRR